MYVKLTGRVLVNLHDLNNEASIGTFTDIRKMKIIDTEGALREVISVSGNMLKHWHSIYVKRLLEGNDNFCSYCAREEAWRLPQNDSRLTEVKETKLKGGNLFIAGERKLLNTCAIEDIHGFLSPDPDLTIKRESRVRFSWLVPVEETEEEALSTAVHNRVAKVTGAGTEIPQQMFFYKQYASGIYSVTASIDLGRIGISDYTSKLVEGLKDEVVKRRRRCTIEAFIPIMGGEMGASLSRSLPIAKPVEIVIALSNYPGLPNVVSAFYKDYRQVNLALMNSVAKVSNSDIHLIFAPPMEGTQNISANLKLYNETDMVSAIRKALELI
ncbi:MAG: DevR family CRISPR-associated autoregulator [Nitrososphaerales archaeon]